MKLFSFRIGIIILLCALPLWVNAQKVYEVKVDYLPWNTKTKSRISPDKFINMKDSDLIGYEVINDSNQIFRLDSIINSASLVGLNQIDVRAVIEYTNAQRTITIFLGGNRSYTWAYIDGEYYQLSYMMLKWLVNNLHDFNCQGAPLWKVSE